MTPNVTSWGGNAVYYEGKWHMYVAEMVNGCGLSTWTTNSQVVHAVSEGDSPAGPYKKVDVALLPWAHNPQVVLVPAVVKDNKTVSAAQFVLFHIGPGDGTAHTKQCHSNASSLGPLPPPGLEVDPPNGNVVHVSSHPGGPWNPVTLPFGCNNPSPMFVESNRTWFVLCNDGGWSIHTATELQGPWTAFSSLPHVPPGMGVWEDPYLFIDPRGNWHALAHAYNSTTPCGKCDSPLVSGHFFSSDGKDWTASTTSPYSNTVHFDDGSVHVFSTRERPKLLFHPETGEPTHLINGVNPMTTCPPVSSVNCKCVTGIDYDFTLIQPFAS